MDNIYWLDSDEGMLKGVIHPYFRITKYKSNEIYLYIFDDRPQAIKVKSVRQGKIKAKKYLDAKIYEKFGE
jgi:hypothetical protein